jgi:putative CocE/NonD family hydrolase
MLENKIARAIAKILILIASVAGLALAQSQTKYEILATKNVMVPMRDGIRLATDIYRPSLNGEAVSGKFPVVLIRSPYDRSRLENYLTGQYVSRGYAAVVQSVRGRYGSEGRWRLLRDDPADGFDCAKWITSQPWSNGRIGTLGGSYEGGTQHAIAMAQPSALQAMVPLVAATDVGRYGLRHNGAFEMRFFTWLFSVGNPVESPQYHAYYPGNDATREALQAAAKDYRSYIKSLPFRAGTTPLRMAPDYESELIEVMSHGDYDNYWKEIGVDITAHSAQHKDVPTHHVSGWYDSWALNVANLNYAILAKTKKSLQRLTMGPWIHAGLGDRYAGEADFGPEAEVPIDDLEILWMDRWLKDVQNGADKEGPVRIFVMGGGNAHKTPEGRVFVGGHWRTENEWPLQRAAATPYYLHSDGTLKTQRPGSSEPSRFEFDPLNPVPSIGGNVSSQMGLMQAGPYDQYCRTEVLGCANQLSLASRNDILIFQTPPLKEDLEVTGPLVVDLWASSSAVDTDFTAKLIDVYPPNQDFPNGIELNIADSIVRARYRDSLEKASLMHPGQIYRFRIEMNPTSILFPKGHRIRLDISSSNFPRFDVNPNTGEPLNQNRHTIKATNSIYHDSDHPTHIILPVIPE